MMLRQRLSRGARRRHQARRHRIHADLVGRELVRQRARKSDKPGFGCHDMRSVRSAGMGGEAADVYDCARAAVLEMG